jgi:hypothetical protein
MYENIFSHNFILNFFFGFFFLISNVLFTLCVTKNDNVKRFFFFKEYQSIVIYFLIFCIYSVILNISVITDYKNLSTVIYSIFFLQIFYTIINFGHLKSLLHFKFKNDEKFVILVFFSLFLISILPLSDADSMSIYQYIPATIYNEGLDKVDLIQNLEFTLLSNTEILLLLSSIFKSENLGSQLNLITILFFILVKFKDHKDFSLIILSSPLIIYFISAQKLQLFFGMIFLLLFILVNKNLIKKKIELFIFIILLAFYSSGKFSYILFTIPLYIYFFYKNLNHWKHLILYSLISFIIIYFPLLTIKQIYFDNIIAPFFDNLLGQGLESYNAFVFSIRNSEGWISDPTNLFLYIRPFISFDLSKLSSSLGLIFLLMIFNLQLQKKAKYFPFLIIVLVLITGQILPRYYFEAFLLLAFFYKPKNYYTKLLLYSQVLVIFSISLIYIFISYIKFDVVNNKLSYMNNFSYSFFNSQQHKNDNLNGNILDFALDRQSIFFEKNVYSLRYINILSQYNGDFDKELIKFINEKSIDYFVVQSIKQIPECILTKEISKTYRQVAVRNFLIKPQKTEYKILEIKDNSCNNIIK